MQKHSRHNVMWLDQENHDFLLIATAQVNPSTGKTHHFIMKAVSEFVCNKQLLALVTPILQ